jgi:transposase-like protein
MFDITNPIFHDADKARAHLEANVWPEGPFCPHCGECENVHRLQGKSHRAGLIQCNSCLKNFTVTVGTVFERSKVPLNKWLLATYLMSSSKKGISAHQIHRMLGVTYKTAWFMCHRIREAMDQDTGPLGGSPDKIIEGDETYVGGSSENRASKKVAPKKAVVTLVERGGFARSFHVANVQGATLRPLLFQHADRLSSLMTDEAQVYSKAGESYWSHQTINHTWEYARSDKGKRVHTNTVENFFSIFKRGIIGAFHHVSEAHLGRYAREFDFRYNHRTVTDGERSDQALRGIVGKRLMYRRPSSLAA